MPVDSGGITPARLASTLLIASMTNSPLAAGRLMVPLIALGLGASAVSVGFLSALFTLVPMVFNVAYGRWVDRVGSLVPFILAHGLIVAGAAAFAIEPSLYALIVAAGLIGSGANFGHLAASRAVSEADVLERRTRNLGYMVMLYSVGQLVAPMMAGYAQDMFGPRAAMASIALFGLVALAGIASRFHAFRRVSAPVSSSPPRVMDLVRHGPLIRSVAFSGVFSAVQTIFPFIVSLHAHAIGLTPIRAALLVGAFSGGVIVARLGVGLLVRRMDRRVIMSAALFTGAAFYVALPLLTAFHPLLITSAALGLTIGVGVPISLSLIYDTAPEGRATEAGGMTLAFTNILQTTLPVVAGVVASGFGVAGMVFLLAATMVTTASFGRRSNTP